MDAAGYLPILTQAESLLPVMSAVADGFPDGWTIRRVPRSGNGNRADNAFYSPDLNLRFRTKPDAIRFVDCLDRLGTNDEAAAYRLMKLGEEEFYGEDEREEADRIVQEAAAAAAAAAAARKTTSERGHPPSPNRSTRVRVKQEHDHQEYEPNESEFPAGAAINHTVNNNAPVSSVVIKQEKARYHQMALQSGQNIKIDSSGSVPDQDTVYSNDASVIHVPQGSRSKAQRECVDLTASFSTRDIQSMQDRSHGTDLNDERAQDTRDKVALPPDMKAQLASLLITQNGKGGLGEGDILSQVKGFVAACQGVGTEVVLSANFPELKTEYPNGKPRFFLASKVEKETKVPAVPSISAEMKASILSLIPKHGSASRGASLKYIVGKIKDFHHASGGSSYRTFLESNLEELVIEETDGTKRYFLRPTSFPESDKGSLGHNERGSKLGKENESMNIRGASDDVPKETMTAAETNESTDIETLCAEIAKVVRDNKQILMSNLKALYQQCYGKPLLYKGKLKKVLEKVEGVSLDARKGSGVLVVWSGNGQDASNSSNSNTDVSGTASVEDNPKGIINKETKIKLTTDQAQHTKFPPGCRVITEFKHDASSSSTRISTGVVLSVSVSLRGDFIYEIKANNAKGMEDSGEGGGLIISESSLAYAPTSFVHYQPDASPETRTESTVLLASMEGANGIDGFRYTVLTVSSDGAHIIVHDVPQEKLSFRATPTPAVANCSKCSQVPSTIDASAPANEAKDHDEATPKLATSNVTPDKVKSKAQAIIGERAGGFALADTNNTELSTIYEGSNSNDQSDRMAAERTRSGPKTYTSSGKVSGTESKNGIKRKKRDERPHKIGLEIAQSRAEQSEPEAKKSRLPGQKKGCDNTAGFSAGFNRRYRESRQKRHWESNPSRSQRPKKAENCGPPKEGKQKPSTSENEPARVRAGGKFRNQPGHRHIRW